MRQLRICIVGLVLIQWAKTVECKYTNVHKILQRKTDGASVVSGRRTSAPMLSSAKKVKCEIVQRTTHLNLQRLEPVNTSLVALDQFANEVLQLDVQYEQYPKLASQPCGHEVRCCNVVAIFL